MFGKKRKEVYEGTVVDIEKAYRGLYFVSLESDEKLVIVPLFTPNIYIYVGAGLVVEHRKDGRDYIENVEVKNSGDGVRSFGNRISDREYNHIVDANRFFPTN